MKKCILILAAVISLASPLAAEKLEMSRAKAAELYSAIAQTEAGFAPANTIAAADDMIALRPHVEALDKGKSAYNRALRQLQRTQPKDAEDQAQHLAEELEAKAAELITVELVPLALTDDEITAAKVKPSALAQLRAWLLPKKK